MITPEEFVQIFKNPNETKLIRFGKIDPAHISGRPRLIFDGESIVTVKRYNYLSSYNPKAGDRVFVLNNVVIGAIL